MRFSLTRWTMIRLAQQGDPDALHSFALKYRAPVVAFLSSRGEPSEAEDLAQEVLLRFLRDGVLSRAEPGQGRFRSLVFAVARNVLLDHKKHRNAQKRGGGQVYSLGEADPPAEPEEEEVFNREWAVHLLEGALERLEQSFPHYHRALRGSFLEGRSHDSIAEEMGKTRDDVKNYVYRGKNKLAAYLREAVWEYSSSQRECSEELGTLSCYFGSKE